MPARYKILVLSLTRMGDIVQSIPFFRRLRLKHADAEIHVLVEQCFADVAKFIPGVDRIVSVRLEDLLLDLGHGKTGNFTRATAFYREFIADLGSKKYDEVWNLTHTRPSMVINYLLASEKGRGVTLDRLGLQRVNSPWLAYFFASNLARPWCSFNLVDIYANCVEDVPWDAGRSIRLAPEMCEEQGKRLLPDDPKRAHIAIHPGASQKDKQWPTGKYRAVAEKLSSHPDTDIILIAGPADLRISEQFAKIPNLIDLAGKTSPTELAGVLSRCRLLISNDSGPMHIAAAVGTPVLDITVGSALASETAPYGEGHIVVEPDSPCFPCSPRRPCPDSMCAERISSVGIAKLAEWMLGWRAAPPRDDLGGCRVYRTTHQTADGLLALKREFSITPYERDTINDVMRGPWQEILAHRRTDDVPDLSRIADHRLWQRAEQAAGVARIASGIARQLSVAGRRNHYNATIENLGLLLHENEERLFGILAGTDILSAVQSFISISRGSLAGETLEAQASETADLYGRIAKLLSGLHQALITTSITKRNNKAYSEEYHENHPQRS